MTLSTHLRHRDCNMEGFFQDPLENEEIYDWHQTVCEDQNCDGIHALANGVLKVGHQIGHIVDGRLEQVGELFKDRLFLSSALHSLIEFVGTVFRVYNRVLHICCEIRSDIVGNMRAARNDKSNSQTEHGNSGCDAFQ